MLNKASNLLWNAVCLLAALFVLDAFAGTSTAVTLWNAVWTSLEAAWNDPTNVVGLATAGAILAVLATYDQIRAYARSAISSAVNAVVETLTSLVNSVKPKADA